MKFSSCYLSLNMLFKFVVGNILYLFHHLVDGIVEIFPILERITLFLDENTYIWMNKCNSHPSFFSVDINSYFSLEEVA